MVVFTFATKNYSFTPGWDQLWTRPLQAASVTSGDTDPVLSRNSWNPEQGPAGTSNAIRSCHRAGISGEVVSPVVPF